VGPRSVLEVVALSEVAYISYTRRFGIWLYSPLQVTGCHYTDRFYITGVFFLRSVATVRI
jgi:hypothetical protein